MQHCQTYALRAGLALSGLIVMASAPQAGTRTAMYVTNQACQSEGLLTAEECRNAFTNAEAEYNDNVPVFDQKADCEREFRRCIISFAEHPETRTELRFAPKMKGVQVSVSSEKLRTVVPVLEGSHPAVRFDSRTLLSVQDVRSSLKQQDAQTRWVEFQRQALAPKFIEWCTRFCEAFSKQGNPASRPPQSGTARLSPHVDPSAQATTTLETHRFSQHPPTALQDQLRFVPKRETESGDRAVVKDVNIRLTSAEVEDRSNPANTGE
jgi:hypothetical protein